MTCFARSDPNKRLFTKNEKFKRTNFYSLVKIQNSEVRFLNETYPLGELEIKYTNWISWNHFLSFTANVCDKTEQNQPCTIPEGKVLELHPQTKYVGIISRDYAVTMWRISFS